MRPEVRLAILALLVVSVMAGLACEFGGKSPSAETPSVDTPSPQPPTSNDLAKAVVQIVALDAGRAPVWSGSGTVITPEGLILTNAHVVDDRSGEYDVLGVAVISRADEPPEPSYLAEIAAVDYTMDLAVVRILSDLDGNTVNVDLPFVAHGDSDDVGLGDDIRILGFPGIGGDTITFTDGVVSGFTSERGLGTRAWIKTDATIAGGNSGGLAGNAAGELIGVPTIAGSGLSVEESVDCRYVADTNRDGLVDELDTCVPVGGFINGLRPVNLALPLIEAAEAGDTYVSPFPQPEPPAATAFDTSGVMFRNLVFAAGVSDDDMPTQVVDVYPSGITAACAFWEYAGMADGLTWEAMWFINGRLAEAGSFIDATWVGGEIGAWWVCNVDESGLPDGLYELVLSVEGEVLGGDAVFVGGRHPLVEFSLENLMQEPICYLWLSPTGAQNWGQDELGENERILPGETATFLVPAGIHDLLVENCDLETMVEEYELDIRKDAAFQVFE